MRPGKLLLVSVAAAGLFGGSMAFTYRVGLLAVQAQAKMAARLLVLRQVEDFASALKDTETGQRGFLLTGQDSYLKPYQQGLSQVQAGLQKLRQLAARDELSSEQVQRVATLTGQKLAELDQTIQVRRESGLAAALSLVENNRSQELMDQLRAELAPMLASQEADFNQASRRANWATGARNVTYLAACCLNLAFLAWIFVRISREMRRREAAAMEFNREKERLATTLASIGDGVILTDPQGRVTFLNPEAERLTGWRSPEAIGHELATVFRIVNEQTRQPAENPVHKALRLGTVVGLANHTLLLGKNGVETPIDDTAAPIRQPCGALFGVVLVFRDFTARRKAEESSARLSAIVESSGDAIISKNLEGVIQTWNSGAQRLFGYCPEEIIGQPVTRLIPEDHLGEEREILQQIRNGQLFQRIETVRLAKDGRRIPVSLIVSPIKNSEGRVIGASKIVHDITEAVALRDVIAREKELLATTLASIGDGVIVTDAGGLVTFLNPEAERLTGWKSAEAKGQQVTQVFRIVNEQSRQPIESPVDKVLRLGTVADLANHTLLLARNGGETPINDSAAPIRQPGGPVFGVVLVFRDFTEQKRSQQALRAAHEQLADRAGQLERAVEERTARLREVIAEMEHVSYAIVHDVRAPLRAMQAFARILEEEAEAEDPAQRVEYARRIATAASRLDKLTQDTLNYNKAVLRQTPLAPVDLSKLLPELIKTYPNLDPAAADIRIESRLPVVLANEALLTECFSNLLGNAVKFVAPGTRPRVRIWAEPARAPGFNHQSQLPTFAETVHSPQGHPAWPRPITVPLHDSTTAPPLVRIWVEDNGIGISKRAQARLFRLFERLTSDYEGTGLGLAIVRKVVERMGGKVGCESEPGRGSRFWVELREAEHEMTVLAK